MVSRTTADAKGEVVVLLIGMRINRFWAVHLWLPVMLGMFRMLRELEKDPARGLRAKVLLTASLRTYYVVQYWESKDKLYAYATAPDAFHHRAWAALNRKERSGRLRGQVGIWHEAYVVPEAGAYRYRQRSPRRNSSGRWTAGSMSAKRSGVT
ncbi:monooxygenase family protein, partial [Streptomyces sp. NPDC003233]